MDDFTRSDDCAATADAFDLTVGPEPQAPPEPVIPDYLMDTYYWAYINPRNVKWLDREIVVRTILWQQHKRLQKLAYAEIEPGQKVMQPASVYGSFGPNLARHVGPRGSVDIIDVAKVQVTGATRKLEPYPWAQAHHSNCLHWEKRPYDVVVCYFLLHEVPDEVKHQVVNHLLGKVEPGGKVVFVDYALPKRWHPLKWLTGFIFDWLEPFAKTLWFKGIHEFADEPDRFDWRRETIFGDLFQKVVATRKT